MRRLLAFLFVLLSVPVMAAEGPGGSYVKPAEAYTPFIPLDNIFNLHGATDSSGNLLVVNATAAGQTPLTPIGQLLGRTDGSGNLFVNCTGCTSPLPTFTRVGIGVAPGATALLTLLSGGIIAPSADSTTAIGFTKADAATHVLDLDTTNANVLVGAASNSNGYGFIGQSNISLGYFSNGLITRTGTGNGSQIHLSAGFFSVESSELFRWSATTIGGSYDTAIGRNAAGVVEVNNGTAGTFRDLITRSLATGTATYGAAPLGTVASGTGITVNATGDVRDVVDKVTLTFAAFSAAATTADATIYTLAAKQKLLDIYADVTQVFSGGAVSAASMTCGISAGGNTILVSFDVKTATIQRGLADADLGTALTRSTAIQGGFLNSWTATTPISCRMTTVTANTNALTQGSITFYLTTRAF